MIDRPLSVLLVEDDQATCAEIMACIEARSDMTLIGVTNNSSKAVELIRDCLPDALILDLELHQGGGNGLLVLQEARLLSLPVFPYILVTTHNSSAITYETARQLGADFILSKHQEHYTPKSAVEFLGMMRVTIQSRAQYASRQTLAETPAQNGKRIARRITAELNLVGISPKVVGYQYLTRGIEIILEGPTQNLCNIIGQEFGKTEASVERAMQNAINRAWRASPIEELLYHYTAHIHSEKGVPTVTEFVHYYATKISNEY